MYYIMYVYIMSYVLCIYILCIYILYYVYVCYYTYIYICTLVHLSKYKFSVATNIQGLTKQSRSLRPYGLHAVCPYQTSVI